MNITNEMGISDDVKSDMVAYVGSSNDEWILDSGCTFRIYHNKNWLDTF